MKHARLIALASLLFFAPGCAGVTFSQVVKATAMGARAGCRLLLATEIGNAEEADTEPPVNDPETPEGSTSGGEGDSE